ncbi:hypothetical protein AKJ64_01665 [candidate division MSBL1 archaeon SCGC-AAA259E17]|uniref:Uncharacterized protein n=1 Tax=candidate division MSBL1 archaeon SCGC-AAA259E17 TaxID=1698263 RepID=A0A133UFR6_9EURY|nr:hypothetical protein AKJ64_01665 [candidate division MSBL1 archaeon SCGC-AAA259E17]
MNSDLPSRLRGSFERREYQVKVFDEVRSRNSLVELPTGLGITMIAVDPDTPSTPKDFSLLAIIEKVISTSPSS